MVALQLRAIRIEVLARDRPTTPAACARRLRITTTSLPRSLVGGAGLALSFHLVERLEIDVRDGHRVVRQRDVGAASRPA